MRFLGETIRTIFRSQLSFLLATALVCGVVVGLVFGSSAGLWIGVTTGLGQAVSIVIFLVVLDSVDALARELSSSERQRNSREVPSSSLLVLIRLSIVGSLFAGGLAGVFAGLIVAWPGTAEYGRSYGVITGVAVALSLALLLSGIPLAEQILLRFLIARSGILPWPGRPLLDYASRLLLLRKVGQDYLFVHRELLDFFADPPPEWLASLLPESQGRNVRVATSNPVVSPPE